MKKMERSSLWKSFWKLNFSKLLIRRKLFSYLSLLKFRSFRTY
uniref:Kinectin 1 n=1 Tax=Pipistrellus kuhlii TaxID=59472 RepID=A0A7J8B0X4_PIPKU|nr:kinectin 1 [Pipistrellus kuhlii]